jgi:hypothetical protein
LQAAEQVAADQLSDAEIARQAGISRRALLESWKARPEFIARVNELRRETAERLREERLTTTAGRLAQLVEDYERTQTVIDERAADPLLQRVPGGRTGIVTRRDKTIPNSNPQLLPTLVTEDLVDVPLLRERRAQLEAIRAEVEALEFDRRLQAVEQAAGVVAFRPRPAASA